MPEEAPVMTACGRSVAAITIFPLGHGAVAGVIRAVPAPVPGRWPPPRGGVPSPPPVTACTGWLDAVRLRRMPVIHRWAGRPR